MCRSTRPPTAAHPRPTNPYPAHTLSPPQRQRLAVEALAGTVPITELADQTHVSRRFVYRQQASARLVRFLNNRAYGVVEACDRQQRRMTRAKRHGRGNTQSKRLAPLRREQERAIALADEMSVLVGWVRDDIFTVAGPDHHTRCHLFDFVVAELESRQTGCPHRIGPVVRALRNQRDDLLAFAAVLDR